MIVSVFLRERASNYSSVKFGSWDPSATTDGTDQALSILQTINENEWSLRVKNYRVNNGQLITDERKFHLAYHLPYLYLPDKEFDQYVNDIKAWDSKILCHTDICWYDSFSCDNAPIEKGKHFNISFTLFDNKNKDFSVTVPVSHSFYIRNEDLKDTRVFCALPVIRSTQKDQQDTWHVGSTFMSYFYTVLDQTPKFERGQNYIQVGFAPRNANIPNF